MTRTALALSPHLDDAVFSCGGTLHRLARSGWRVVVATLFTRSMPEPDGFALACQLDKGIGPAADYMALRREEDRAALDLLGCAPPRHLPFAEAPHRGYASAAALFGAPHDDDGIVAPLARALRSLLEELVEEPDLVLVPQAIGGHVDHVQSLRALQTVSAQQGALVPGVRLLWWRDFPYASRTDAVEPFAVQLRSLPTVSVRLEICDLAAREAACAAYASQIGFQFGGRPGLHRKLAAAGPVEHFRGTAGPIPPFRGERSVTNSRSEPTPQDAGEPGRSGVPERPDSSM